MRPLFVLLVLLLLPFSAAHSEPADDAHNGTHVDAQLGPGVSGANDFSRVNPFVLAGRGEWGSALLFAAVWLAMLAGLWQLVKLIGLRMME